MSVELVLSSAATVYSVVAMALLVWSVASTILQPRIAARRRTQRTTACLSRTAREAPFEEVSSDAEISLRAGSSEVDVTVSAVKRNSPAVEKMREIFARYPERPSRVLLSTARFAASPKVDNLFAPFMQARHDVILMKDANVLLEPDALSEHMRQLADEVGLVCAIPYCARLDNFAAHVEAWIINGPHARMLFLASCLGQGHGVGKIMLFRRSDFLRAGGFDAISHTVGEDNALAKAMRQIGTTGFFAPAGAAGTRFAGIRGRFSTAIALERHPAQRRASVLPAGADLPGFSGSYRRRAGRAADRLERFCGFCRHVSVMVRAGDIAFHGERMAVILSGACGFRCPRGCDACGLGERLDDQPCGLGEGQSPRARRGAAGAPRARRRITFLLLELFPVPGRRGRLSVRPRPRQAIGTGYLVVIGRFLYDWLRGARDPEAPTIPDAELPHVLLQIPVFNEPLVTEQSLRCVAQLNWPKDRLRIQLLDNSTNRRPAPPPWPRSCAPTERSSTMCGVRTARASRPAPAHMG